MKLKTKCGQCGAGFSFPANLLGETKSCPKCGERIVLDGEESHPVYSSAGLAKQSKFETATRTKKCPHCEGEVSDTATKCRHCGEFLNAQAEKKKKLPVAALLSFLFAGIGQVYKGEIVAGIIMFLIVAGFYLTGIPGFQIIGFAMHMLTVIDAGFRAV